MFAFLAAVGTLRRGSYCEGLIFFAGHTVGTMVEVSICKNKKFFHSDTSGHKVSCSQHLIARACAHTLSTRASTSTRVLQAMSYTFTHSNIKDRTRSLTLCCNMLQQNISHSWSFSPSPPSSTCALSCTQNTHTEQTHRGSCCAVATGW